jgi:YfiR/HmsC-like
MALLRRRRPHGSLLLALFCCPLLVGATAPQSMPEAQVKAAMVYNFASFTEWPDAPAAGRSLVVGVIGNDALAKSLQSMGKLGNGRDVEVRMLGEGDNLTTCQVLYFSGISNRAAAATLARVSKLPVLTVGEQEHFTQLGGIIRVYQEGNRLRFEVDVTRASSVRLKISSRVLNLARLVKDADAPNH